MKPEYYGKKKLAELSGKIVEGLASTPQGITITNNALSRAEDIDTWRNNKMKLKGLKNMIKMMLKMNKKEGQIANAIKNHDFKSYDPRYAFIDKLLDEGILKEDDFNV